MVSLTKANIASYETFKIITEKVKPIWLEKVHISMFCKFINYWILFLISTNSSIIQEYKIVYMLQLEQIYVA